MIFLPKIMKKYSLNNLVLLIALLILSTGILKAQIVDKDLQINKKKSNLSQVYQADIQPDDLVHLGDLIEVDIIGSLEYDWRGTLSPEGFLDGIEFTEKEIYGLCKSEVEISSIIAKSYQRFLNNPKVSVKILDRSNRPISILYGAVNQPQKFKIRRPVYLNELIVRSGGFTDQASGEIQILRQPDSSCAAKYESERKNIKNYKKENQAFLKVKKNTTNQLINVNIADILDGKKGSNPQILYGDMITVKSAEPVYIIGGVVNPTKIAIRSQLTVSRAIASAGGLTDQANSKEISIYRRENGTTKIIKATLADIKSNPSTDIFLKPYDIVEVSETGRSEKKYPPIIQFEGVQDKLKLALPTKIID
jgi:protein involved in polysaccharide export with SLBB domain